METPGSEVNTDQPIEKSGSDDLGWRSALPDDLKNHEFVKDYSKPGDAIRDFVNLKQEAASMLKVPGKDATDEQRAAFYNALGRPESPDKYTIGKPEGLPDYVPYSQENEAAFRTLVHETGLSDSQAQKLNQWYWNTVKSEVETEQNATNEAINKLKDEWKGDTFKVNTEKAARAFKKFGGEEAASFLESIKANGVPLGSHPLFLKTFHAIAEAVSDDFLSAGGGNNKTTMSDEQLAQSRFPNTQWKNQ